jgi:GAF domain-containing protein
MGVTQDEDKPCKTDLARKSAQRREQVLSEIEEAVKKAPSFEEALKVAVETMKKKFARYSSVTAWVADGEGLAVHMALERPHGPERVGTESGPIADAAHATGPTMVSDLLGSTLWSQVGLTTGSVMVAPVRTEAGLWALLEVWSDFRDAFTPQDVKLAERLAAALAKKTPSA